MQEEITQEWIEERRAALPGEILEMINRRPGMPKSYYIYRSPEYGGLRGLSQDKYAALEQLVVEGKVELGCGRGKFQSINGYYPAGHPERDVPFSDEYLENGLQELVMRDPGRGQSHYCRLPLAEGGLRGSQERKEKVMKRLLREGKLVLVGMNKPVGRLTHAVFPPYPELASAVG